MLNRSGIGQKKFNFSGKRSKRRSSFMGTTATQGRQLRTAAGGTTRSTASQRPPARSRQTGKAGSLRDEIVRLASALQEGQLAERANAALFQGEDRELAEAVNTMLDVVIRPLKAVAGYFT